MTPFLKPLSHWWRPLLLVLIAAGISLFTLCYHLVKLAPRLSSTEQTTRLQSTNLQDILSRPLNSPYHVLEWLAIHGPQQWTILFTRLPSVLLGLAAIAMFVHILRRWYGKRSMVFGFFIVLSSAWFLHISRFGGPDIEYFAGILALLTAHVGLHDAEDSTPMFFVWLVVNLVLLSVPGLVWFVVVSALLQILTLVHAWQYLEQVWQHILWTALALFGIAVPVVAIVRRSVLLTDWLGLPRHWAPWHTLPNQLLQTFEAIAYRGPHRPELWLGQLPILDTFIAITLLAGIFFYAKHWHAARTHLLGAYLLVGIILVSIGSTVMLSVLVPIFYLVAVAGIAYLLYFWVRAFPLNPIARTTGIAIVTLVVGLSCYYNLVQYFVAWPHNPEVAAIYSSH